VTTVSHSVRHPEPARVIDVRCSAALPSRTDGQGRCQLFAGHDGPHAVMFGRAGARVVRTWLTSDPAGHRDCDGVQRPWMFGFPVPAWFEAGAAPDLAD
jgi:hypothetical protein